MKPGLAHSFRSSDLFQQLVNLVPLLPGEAVLLLGIVRLLLEHGKAFLFTSPRSRLDNILNQVKLKSK